VPGRTIQSLHYGTNGGKTKKTGQEVLKIANYNLSNILGVKRDNPQAKLNLLNQEKTKILSNCTNQSDRMLFRIEIVISFYEKYIVLTNESLKTKSFSNAK